MNPEPARSRGVEMSWEIGTPLHGRELACSQCLGKQAVGLSLHSSELVVTAILSFYFQVRGGLRVREYSINLYP